MSNSINTKTFHTNNTQIDLQQVSSYLTIFWTSIIALKEKHLHCRKKHVEADSIQPPYQYIQF